MRSFDYVLEDEDDEDQEDEEENEESESPEKAEDPEKPSKSLKPSQVPIVTGMDTQTQLKILDLKIEDLLAQL